MWFCSMVVSSMKVRDVSELTPGDHIKWKRLPGYDHHAIVEEVDHDGVHVIEYGGKGRAGIRRNVIPDESKMHRYIYDRSDDGGKVLERARSRLGERAYNVVTNNCEHLATWCKTGYKRCFQIPAAIRRMVISAVECASGAGGTVAGRCVAKCAVAAAARGTTTFKELARLTWPLIKKAVANGGKAIGRNAMKSACKAGVIGVASVLIEGGLFAYKCYKAYGNVESNEEIREAGYEAVGTVIGGAALGAAIGSFIPVAGTAIGALIGGIGGRILCRAFGRWLHG